MLLLLCSAKTLLAVLVTLIGLGNVMVAAQTTTDETPATPPLLSSCTSSFAYCPGISTCFIGMYGTHGYGAWGWSIDLQSLQPGQTINCPIYAGAGQCDLSLGTIVGELSISPYAVTWQFKDGVGGQDFHFYSGKCEACDGGDSLPNLPCNSLSMQQNIRRVNSYTLTSNGVYDKGYKTMSYTWENFKAYRQSDSKWGMYGYVPFAVGFNELRYISAHSTVCPCGSDNQYCY